MDFLDDIFLGTIGILRSWLVKGGCKLKAIYNIYNL